MGNSCSERNGVHDQYRKGVSQLQQPSVVIGAILPCSDLKQRLRKIYDNAIIKYEKKKTYKHLMEKESDT
jgi:hypothetical protein